MKFEFNQSFPKLRYGGIILSDNAANINSAFSEFAGKNGTIISDFGIMVK